MAHTKAQGSVRGNRDSIAKRLGVKLYAGEMAQPGSIIIRQKGTKFFPGNGVSMGKDYTIFAIDAGVISFKKSKGKKIIELINRA